ncbi:MAG: DUF2778 domain-containing protein [Xanthobacteraceae bacterium]
MLRLGVGPVAGGLTAFAIGFGCYVWLPLGSGPANVDLQADARAASAPSSSKVALGSAALAAGLREKARARLASLQAGELGFTTEGSDSGRELFAGPSFADRFSFEPSTGPSLAWQGPASSFDDRFGSAEKRPAASAQATTATGRAREARVAGVTGSVRGAAPSALGNRATKRSPEGRFQLASATDSPRLAYAPADGGDDLKDLTSKDANPLGDIDASHTAIYDITSHTVYLPSGRRLEAHSGLGTQMDNPQYVRSRMTGPTPPNVYDLRMREATFHGVEAIRLIPTDHAKMYGRAGILAHSYMLGANGQSNGCVSFKDYPAFLDAFRRGEIKRIAVVERLADPPPAKTAADWLSNTVKDMFGGT